MVNDYNFEYLLDPEEKNNKKISPLENGGVFD
jgi:hypothetical protein